ncbi:MAG: rRNA adenine N-6-methyltransferase family protein [bacterium]
MSRTLEQLINELRKYGITEKTLEVFKVIKREWFVEDKEQAYLNEALPFFGQTTSQPLVIANIIDELELSKQDIVLEVGTGSGFQTCLIAYLAFKVYSFEIDHLIYKKAIENISYCQSIIPNLNIEVIRKDIFNSYQEIQEIIRQEGRIDKAVFSFSINKIPTFISESINLIIAPIDINQKYQKLQKIIRQGDKTIVKDLGYVSFVKARREK